MTATHPAVRALLERGDRGITQRTPQWYSARRDYITASEVASALGQNKFETKATYVKQKAGIGPRFQGNVATEWGAALEDSARALYEQKTGEVVLEWGMSRNLTKFDQSSKSRF